MLNPDLLNDKVLTNILENKRWSDDATGCARVAKLSNFDAFDAYLRYEGIIGYTQQIITALDNIRAAQVA